MSAIEGNPDTQLGALKVEIEPQAASGPEKINRDPPGQFLKVL
jgi:hypothetical protein